MKFAELNKKGTMPDNLNTDNFEYKKLLEFAGKTVVVRGFFFNEKGKYGNSRVRPRFVAVRLAGRVHLRKGADR